MTVQGNGGPEAVLTDTVESQMAVFDQLPKYVRNWLNYATFNYDTRHAREYVNTCLGMPAEAVLCGLERYDRERAAGEYARVHGP